MAAWLPLVQVLERLPGALDRQLREEAGMPHAHYQVLAMLSAEPGQALRMSELAARTATSLSRLSHAVTALEAKGWVRRTPCPDDRRAFVATLTGDGRRLLREVAPGHVEAVRRLVLDPLEPEEVQELGRLAAKLLPGLSDRASPPRSGC